MGILEDFQAQAQAAGAQAAQGAIQQAQLALPGFVEQASQHAQAQVQNFAPAVHDLGREGGTGVREGIGGLDTTTIAVGAVGAVAVLGLIVFAATRAGSPKDRALAPDEDFVFPVELRDGKPTREFRPPRIDSLRDASMPAHTNSVLGLFPGPGKTRVAFAEYETETFPAGEEGRAAAVKWLKARGVTPEGELRSRPRV